MALTKVSSKTLSDNAITADKIATGAITITDIPDGEITADKLHTTAITDKLGYTPVAPNDSPVFSGLTVDTDTLYVDSTNNVVGIGATAPSTYANQKLVVFGQGVANAAPAGTTVARFEVFSNGQTNNQITLSQGFGGLDNIGFLYNRANADFVFGTNNTERMRIDSSGNVGIGRSSGIGHRLALLGNTQATSSIQMTYTGVASSTIGVTSGGDIAFGLDGTAGNTERMRITNTGNVGIGTSSPSQILDLSAISNPRLRFEDLGNFEYTIGIKDNDAFTISSGGTDTERMRIDSSGNVLVGTAVPRASTVTPKFIINAGNSSATTIKTMPCALAITNNFNGNSTDYGASIKMHLSSDGEVGKYAAISVYASRTFANGTGLRFWTNPTGENGTDNTTQRMQIDHSGSIGAGGSATNIYNASDRRLKKDVEPILSAINTINALNPVSFKWIDGFTSDEQNKTLYGFVAQEVEQVDTNLIENFGNSSVFLEQQNSENLIEVDNPLRVNEKFIIPLLTKAIQELKTENDTLKSQLLALETRIQALENK